MYGIVLSRRDFREADQVISILTAEEGKREYIARGVKKLLAKIRRISNQRRLLVLVLQKGRKNGRI